jgi:hypothetical protein
MDPWIEGMGVDIANKLWILITRNVDFKIRHVNNKNSIVFSPFSAVYSKLQLLDCLW